MDGAPSTTARSATTVNVGATTRAAVSESGRGAEAASRPAAHDSHNNTSPTSSGASAQSRSAADTAGPAVRGSVTHTTRSAHSTAGRAPIG